MLKKICICIALPLLSLAGPTSANPTAENSGDTGILEKMIASNGRVTITINLASLNRGPSAEGKPELETVDFGVGASSFFTILVFNDVLRTTLPGSLELVPSGSSKLTKLFGSSFNQLVVERTALGGTYDLVVRDGKSGFVFFNVEGDHYDYNPINHLLQINGGRLLVSDELAQQLGRKENAPLIVGSIAITTTMDLIETTKLSNGAVVSAELPSADSGAGAGSSPNATLVPGPDVIVGDLPALIQTQTGNVNGFVGLSLGTTSCNNGNRPLDWFALPSSNDHPVIPQNLYRMSGGTVNADRFEQIGQSWLKHAFEALEDDDCSFGCNTSHCTTGTHLCEGCSDPYSASLNGSQTSLGSRAWVNPFTGSFPTSPNPNDHTGHVHDVTSHRILVNMNDLNTTLNPGATYYGESQYVTPHEYTWCQAHPGQCNMYNNVSYRQFLVTGTSNFTFTPSGATVRTTPAIYAWTGATITRFEPDPGNDGIGFLGYKVTNPTTGVWHYEYAVYNENLDRAVQSFSVPLGCGVTVSNLDFHAPPQQPGWANDGTQNDAGYSSTPWSSNQTASTLSWSSETFAQNQNANAIRWGTLYNFRFDSNQPPQAANATLGFFKTGSPITVAIQAPASNCGINLVSASSRLTHGSAGDFDINMPVTGTSGVEDRSSSTYNAVFTFDAPVTSGSVTVTSGTATVGAITFSGNEMRAALTGVTDVQTVVLHTSNINGDGQAHGDVSFSFLIGDIDGDRTVGTTDKNSLSANKGLPVTGANFRNDLNLSGVVDKPDQALFNANKGHHL